jgi:hypothetical protein
MDEFLKEGESLKRLLFEYKKYGSLYGAFDFDGTVHDYHQSGASHEQVRQLIRDLYSIGCKLDCWTAYIDHSYVINFLKENNIPYERINGDGIILPWTSRKPFHSFLLDDRAGLTQVYNELTELVKIIKEEK